ncbi:hypothetical protein KFE98_21630 [bacterium SCSIO 12741]|nr:hypothetical protein KFE98_21630 [bacterium SCSIO 12741]
MKIAWIIGVIGVALALTSCSKKGCTDSRARNFSAEATEDDGTCILAGCTDSKAENYVSWATEDDGSCTYPTQGDLELAFDFQVNGQALEYNKTFQTVDQKYVSFSRVQFYASGINGWADSTHSPKHDLSDVYLLVNPDNKTYSIGKMDPGAYVATYFSFGVDSLTNNTKQPVDFEQGHPLGFQDPNMHWGWRAMYQFIKLEGKFDSDGDQIPDLDFEYHIGADQYYQQLVFWDKPFTIEVGNTTQMEIVMDCGMFLNGVDIVANPTSHSTDATSNAIMANTSQVFK